MATINKFTAMDIITLNKAHSFNTLTIIDSILNPLISQLIFLDYPRPQQSKLRRSQLIFSDLHL